MVDRRAAEIAHGALIASRAEEVWGWTSPAGHVRWQRRVDFLAQGIRAGEDVLELGCGTGVLTEALAKTGACVTAVDISEDLLLKARSRVKGTTRFLCQDLEVLNVPSSSFDIVVGSSVLHHVNAERVLALLRRALRPGGRVRFTEPNMMNPQIFLQKNIPFLKRWAGDTPTETAFFRGRLADLMRSLGYVNVVVENFDFLHPFLPGRWVDSFSKFALTLEKIPVIKEISGSLMIQANQEGAYAPRG